ncbi:helix-turn-helix transcriptional regulator [Nesterenkonia aurantiaca]|uniref:helix-turn-helix domain-containing protein n=1 Tax=Nesterenkonia aurantiaca TaxID=1436010 RepID=UPI003EE67174
MTTVRTEIIGGVAGPLEGLSARERQVAVLIADGWTDREMAEELGVSVRTVDFHVRNALTKFDVTSRHEIRHRLREGSCGN